MRREELYLTDIIEAADAVQRFLKIVKKKTFLENDLLQSAVLQKLMIIGEAASRLPKAFRERHPEIEWEDMAEGRSRIPFQAGKVNIHSVSASAIEQIKIEKGESKPIRIVVRMSNSAGIFQLDELLKDKLEGSGLEPYVEVEAMIKGEAEKKLIQTFRI